MWEQKTMLKTVTYDGTYFYFKARMLKGSCCYKSYIRSIDLLQVIIINCTSWQS